MIISRLGVIALSSGILTLALACSSTNPLDGYQQLVPTTVMEQPEAKATNYPPERVARGKYLISLLGCGTCHTDGALIGEAKRDRLLAGSGIGIAYSNPLVVKHPGVVYPSNLTPDPETGIGNWSDEQIVSMVRTGTNNHGGNTIAVMPWPAYAIINDDDVQAIAAYLKSLPPIKHRVPRNVRPGQRASAPFVHFGIYRSKATIDQ